MDARTAYYLEAAMSNGLYGSLRKFKDAQRYMDDYLSNRNMDYSDIRYPSMTVGYQATANMSNDVLNFVSSNILRLYK